MSMSNFGKIGQSVAKILRFFWPPQSWIVEFTKFYCLTAPGWSRRIIVPNFIKIGRSIAMMRFFEFSRWPPPPSWIFEIAKFYWLLGSRGWRRISMPNLVKIGQLVAKILRFFDMVPKASHWLTQGWRDCAACDTSFICIRPHEQKYSKRSGLEVVFAAILDFSDGLFLGPFHGAIAVSSVTRCRCCRRCRRCCRGHWCAGGVRQYR